MAQLVASMSGVVLRGVVEVVYILKFVMYVTYCHTGIKI